MKHVSYWKSSWILALVALVVLAAAPAAAQDNSGLPANSITVSGLGQAFGSPDVAYVEVGVEIVDADVATAFQRSNETIQAIIGAVQALGVDAADMRSSNISLYTETRYNPETNLDDRVYHSSNTLRVTVRDIAKVSDVITTAVNAGANSVYGLNFGIADPSALERDARIKAVDNARARAEHLAEIMGVTLGAPIIITERSSAEMPVFSLGAASGLGGGAGVPVEQGQLSVTVVVDVTFAVGQ